jgi:penicillin-binding protein 1B
VALNVKLSGSRPSKGWGDNGGPSSPPRRNSSRSRRPARTGFLDKLLRYGLIAAGACFLLFFIVFAYYYHKYSVVVDQRLQNPLFAQTAKIYAAPREVRAGQRLTPRQIAADLRNAGYSDEADPQHSTLGTFRLNGDSIAIHPGPSSFHAPDGATIRADNGLVAEIVGDSGQPLAGYELEPTLITGLSDDKDRTKRRLLTYDELPPHLVQAVLAIEDRRFFEHGGVNYYRLAKAMYIDAVAGRKEQGASTLTMQLAKLFFLSPEKRYKRKLIQILITFQLEHRFTKKQIFEMYANEINLGQRGSFSIDGFGEAAQAYFGKSVRELDLSECALLAGMIQSPSRLNPTRHPERAMERRNLVLDGMVDTGAITAEQAEKAKAEPLHLVPNSVDAGEAPYFVDLVREQLTQKYGDRDINREGLRIYTSLDPDLQRMATEAVEAGMVNVDEMVRKRDAKLTGPSTYPQVALVALNPHTGQVLAVVGGRNYGQSQLDHAVAKRPTGSIFKPFVYATAFNTSLEGEKLPGSNAVFTPVTILSDEEATYTVGNQSYTPRDYHGESFGQVTARFAIQKSLNRATISLGQMVGFGNVAALARDSGIKSARGTPAVAIGAYDATPLDMAGAYTVFANSGTHIDPFMLASVRTHDGDVIDNFTPETRPVLDPRVAYLTTTLLENVINAGTGYEVRTHGFEAPAAGKTGTSHDAWFAGYTTNLLCIVWVGNDDYTDIKMEGAKAAAPIWAEFMKRAITLPQYSDVKPFAAPSGVVQVVLDKDTNLLANSTCPNDYTATFLEGTQPTDTCDHAEVDQRNLFQKVFNLGPKTTPPVAGTNGPTPQSVTVNIQNADGTVSPSPVQPAEQPQKKRGFFSRLFGKDKNPPPQSPPPAEAPAPAEKQDAQ